MENIVRLRSFLAAYRARSISRAHLQVGLSQPAVTAHISALEKKLGSKLFLRHSRGVEPTPYADELASRIEKHMDALEGSLHALEQTIHRDSKVVEQVVLGGPADLLSMKVLPTLVPWLKKGVPVKVRTGSAEPLLDQLALGEIDLVIATRTAGRRDLRFRRLFDEEYVLVSSPGWAATLPGQTIEIVKEAVAKAPLVAFDEQLPIIRDYFERVFGELATAPRVAIVVNDLRAGREAVIADAGIAVLPRYLVSDSLQRKQLVEPFHPARPPHNTISLASQPGRLPDHLEAIAKTLLNTAPSWEKAGS